MRRLITLGMAVAATFLLSLGSATASDLDRRPGNPDLTPADTVRATGGGSGLYADIDITAESGTAGQDPIGTVSFTFGQLRLAGSVTCLSVSGPDRGTGTLTAPTTAILVFRDAGPDIPGTLIVVKLVDNGGGGADTIDSAPTDRLPADCSPFATNAPAVLDQGRAIIFDALPLPTRKDQCTSGAWRSFGVFKNQGGCISFVRQ